jgi:tetratricopeptide (TPR) repeat protein
VAIDREKALLSAQKFIDKKRYDRALEEYQRVLREEPNDTRTLLKLGDLQIKMQAFEDAMTTYDRVAQLYESQGFAVKAVAVYKQIRDHIQKRSPDLADKFAHVVPRLAQIYAKLQLTSDAIQAYDEVATRYLRLGRKQEAIEIYQQMVALDPSNPLTHIRLAEALCHLEEIDAGLGAFAAAADLLLKLGRDEDVMRVVERALHFKQDPRIARIGAEVHLKRGTRTDGLQALTKLQICFKADPKDLVVFGLLAQAFTLLEQTDKAIEVYKEMALLAREKGENQLFAQLVEHLTQTAPEDDQVRALKVIAAQGQPPPVPTSQHLVAAAPVASAVPAAPVAATTPQNDVPEALDESELVEELDEELEFVDENAPGAESNETAAPSLEAITQKALADADSFRRLRLFDKSVEALRKGLLSDPNSLELRYKLREILYEAGDHDSMLAESLNIATLLINYGYVQEAAPFVEEVLSNAPNHPDAIRLYTQLYGAPPARCSVNAEPKRESRRPSRDEALPSYDIEGARASHAFSSIPPQRLADVDDPFGEEASNYGHESELPSFALDEALASDRDGGAFAQGDLEQLLDDADLYVQRGRRKEARTLLESLLRKHPNHPLILEKLEELAQLGDDRDSIVGETQSHVGAARPSEAPDELAASFEALDHLEMRGGFSKYPPPAPVADVDAVFAQFKAGVRSQVEETDSATHYDLGVAYKEMGLVGDALKEFDLAAKDPARACMCHAMIGLIYLEQNDLEQAITAYKQGLESVQKTKEQELSLCYDLGIAHEMKSDYKNAVRYFREIARTDPDYRDVVERINALEHPEAAAPIAPQAKAAGSEDDFDRAFDDLFGN